MIISPFEKRNLADEIKLIISRLEAYHDLWVRILNVIESTFIREIQSKIWIYKKKIIWLGHNYHSDVVTSREKLQFLKAKRGKELIVL